MLVNVRFGSKADIALGSRHIRYPQKRTSELARVSFSVVAPAALRYAMRRASSFVSSLAEDRRPGSSSRRRHSRQSRPPVPRRTTAAGSGGRAWRGVRLIEVLSGRRETHSRYLWNTRCECRAGSKCSVVSADFDFGRLPKLHLRHV